jgi:hypothetical protein
MLVFVRISNPARVASTTPPNIFKLHLPLHSIITNFEMQKKDEHIGQKLKSYTFIRKLGAGAWATVYEVFDDKTRTSVACTHHYYFR